MALVPITFKPGIQKNTTEYLAEGGWVDCDRIRFRSGVPIQLGGWVKGTYAQSESEGSFSPAFSSAFASSSINDKFTGVVRAMHSWTALDQGKYLVAGSNLKAEILYGGQIFDVTPVRETANLNNAITTYTPSFSNAFSSAFTLFQTTLVKITDSNHNLVAGDYIDVISQQTAVGGITLSGSYKVHTVLDLDNYLVDTGVYATSAESLAGGDLVIDYLLESGYIDNTGLTGWSGGTWGTEGESGAGWGLPRVSVGAFSLRQWSFDEWGEDLIACVNGGKIYHWDKTNGVGTRLQVLSNAPEQNTMVLVSQPSRFLIAFGSEVEATGEFDPLVIRWAEQETLNDWAVTSTNTAGEYRLPKGNKIVTAIQTRSEIVIITETTVYSMQYIGGNNVFSFTPLGTNITITSQNAAMDENGIVRWMGIDGFYQYDGVVRKLASSLQRYLFDKDVESKFNFEQKDKIHAGLNKKFNEVWWFYPRSTEMEISDYVKYNYLENVWDYGTITRTAWLEEGVFEKPYAFNDEGILYTHELGSDDDGSPMNSFITSGYFDIGEGDDIMFVDRVIPDVKLDTNKNIEINFLIKDYPHPNANVTEKGPYYFDDSKDKIDLRARGRQMAIKYESKVTGGDFELGKVRINMKASGKR